MKDARSEYDAERCRVGAGEAVEMFLSLHVCAAFVVAYMCRETLHDTKYDYFVCVHHPRSWQQHGVFVFYCLCYATQVMQQMPDLLLQTSCPNRDGVSTTGGVDLASQGAGDGSGSKTDGLTRPAAGVAGGDTENKGKLPR